MKKVRLGLIGLGYIGKVHLRNCLNLKSAKLTAVCDISRKALRHARKMGVKNTFTDYQQLLSDDSIEAVIIALPTYLHASCVKEAAKAGKDIFLEKPLARNVAEGKDIVSTARKNGVKLMVGYPFRFSLPFQALKEKIQGGELGEVQIAYATNIGSGPFFHRAESNVPRPVPSWWFKKELTGGGALMDVGCHMINLVRWYFGEVSDVKSYMGYRFNLDFEDHVTCILKFKSGQIAIVNAGWFSQKAQIKVELLGTVGHASATHTSPSKIKTAIQLMTGRTPDFYIPHLRELSNFIQCLRHDRPPSPSAEDALKDLETISLAYKNEIRLD
jgi:predicted dehydrogenase